MATKNYSEQLKDPRWQRKRLEIMQRDNFACVECGDTENTLHVHHIKYVFGRMPWQYADENFKTLCNNCHEKEHREVMIGKGTAINSATGFLAEHPEHIKSLLYLNNHKGNWEIITDFDTTYKKLFLLILDILVYDNIPYVYFTINGVAENTEDWHIGEFMRSRATKINANLGEYVTVKEI